MNISEIVEELKDLLSSEYSRIEPLDFKIDSIESIIMDMLEDEDLDPSVKLKYALRMIRLNRVDHRKMLLTIDDQKEVNHVQTNKD